MAKKAAAKKPTYTSTPLWVHQKKAVQQIQEYLTAFTANDSLGACLVHMPTGTGKTGVIACASHFLSEAGCILALCPRVALRDQLSREVSGRFFTKLGLTDELPKTVYNVKKGFPPIAAGDYDASIISMTIQMLFSQKKKFDQDPKKHKLYGTLRKHVGLIIVDEGHYEPALMWSDAIRGIKAPRVIFTATPFRNDLKLFDVSFDHAYSYTFKEATADKTIRKVQFHQRDAKAKSSPTAFVNDVVDFYDTQFGGQTKKASPPRVIIRCDSQAEIRQIGMSLDKAGRSYVLIHENFKDGDSKKPHERKTVPDPSKENAVFWIHQFKLLEGIDDHRFQLLAIYNEFGNTREIVQQIGRVIRNPEKRANAVGHVLDHSEGRQRELWDGFLRFDALVEKEGVQTADFGNKLLKAIQSAVPDVVYLDRRFRAGFQLDQIDPAEELVLPATVNVFRKTADFDLSHLVAAIETEYRIQDRDVRVETIGSAEILIYLSFRNSPLLRSTAFIECRLGVTILQECGDYLCYFDSGGGILELTEAHLAFVDVEELRRLFGKAKNTHLTSVSLHNSNLGTRAIRSRSFSAARIDETIPGFDEHSFVCRTAQGYSDHGARIVRRYVGFGRGKITDATKGGRIRFPKYLEWLTEITDVLASKTAAIGDFTRFAARAAIPTDPEPTSVLLDVAEVRKFYLTHDVDGAAADEPMELDDACSDVENGSFKVSANGKTCEGRIEFDSKSKRYRIESSDLEELYHSQEPGLNRGLVRFLNHQQSFRVIPKSEGSFYTLGGFYSPMMRFGPQYDDDQIGLLKVLYPYAALDTIGSEKGQACAADESAWDTNSLFSIIDLLGVGHGMDDLFGAPNGPDIRVCDDMGTEAADFILADTKKRKVIFIHAKGKGSGEASKYAASPLQEVCGQTTKNLKYYARFGTDIPTRAKKWHSDVWKVTDKKGSKKKPTGRVKKRIREAPSALTTGLQVWNEVRSIIRDPNAELEVWLFLGRLLSAKSLGEQLRKKKPAAQAKQAAYLLFSTMNDVASVGAKLRVVCST